METTPTVTRPVQDPLAVNTSTTDFVCTAPMGPGATVGNACLTECLSAKQAYKNIDKMSQQKIIELVLT